MAEKVGRDAFLYFDPKPPADQFGQCGTCGAWIEDKQRCYWHAPAKQIDADDSCGLYAHGKPLNGAEPTNAVTPQESGLIDGQVRCEHCLFFDAKASECGLYQKLNDDLGDEFDLDTQVSPQGCCNAWKPAKASDVENEADETGEDQMREYVNFRRQRGY